MRKLLLGLLLIAFLLAGCGSARGRPAGQGDLEKTRQAMTVLFASLEMYAQDHKLAYPETAAELVPKYLDAVPADPISGRSLRYQRTGRGYTLSSSGDYTSAGAERGFPRMNQDGFFVLKQSDFPSQE